MSDRTAVIEREAAIKAIERIQSDWSTRTDVVLALGACIEALSRLPESRPPVDVDELRDFLTKEITAARRQAKTNPYSEGWQHAMEEVMDHFVDSKPLTAAESRPTPGSECPACHGPSSVEQRIRAALTYEVCDSLAKMPSTAQIRDSVVAAVLPVIAAPASVGAGTPPQEPKGFPDTHEDPRCECLIGVPLNDIYTFSSHDSNCPARKPWPFAASPVPPRGAPTQEEQEKNMSDHELPMPMHFRDAFMAMAVVAGDTDAIAKLSTPATATPLRAPEPPASVETLVERPRLRERDRERVELLLESVVDEISKASSQGLHPPNRPVDHGLLITICRAALAQTRPVEKIGRAHV